MSTPSLPAPPRALAAILEAASDPGVDVNALGRIVARDPTFAGVVLKMVNTTAYQGSSGSNVTDLRAATMRLGVRTLRNLALCHAARSCISTKRIGSFDLDRFWEDSIRRAVAGTLLAEEVGQLDPSEAFTIGLLQELGVIALLLEEPDKAEAWTKIREADPPVRLQGERDLFGMDHTAVNANLARDWSLPDEIALPLIFHHSPDEAPAPLRRVCRVACGAELFAAVLSHEDTRQALQRARAELPRLLSLHADALDNLVDRLGVQVAETGRAMGISVGVQPTLEDILTQANRSLVDMNLSYEDLVRRLEQAIAEKDALALELDRRNRELEWISITDALTQLPNRRELFRRVTEEIVRLARHGGPTTMLVADIDHFKRVNDTWGHVFGDDVLKAVASTLHQCCRDSDLVARTGGEEFAVLLPATDLHGASYVAKRMLSEVEKLTLTAPDGQIVNVTISIGIAWIQGPNQQRVSIDAVVTHLYNMADQALYHSKTSGRNRATRCPHSLSWTTSNTTEALPGTA